jgi:hypothetical protein
VYIGFKEGFIIGAFMAFLLHLGFLTVTIERETTTILFVLGLFVTLHQAFRRKSLINPPIDGFISGFTTTVGAFDFIRAT